jgi:N-acetyl-alpha-D-muramate 1-phosphate uridylyltransferase
VTLPVALLAGGIATRLRPVTETIPKSLVMVAGRPFIERQLEWLKRESVERVVLCVGYLGERIEDVVRDGRRFGLRVAYSYDGDKLLGTGGALRHALPLLEEAFFVLYGDTFLTCNFASVEAAFRKDAKPAMMTVFANKGRWDTSNAVYRGGRIALHDKKNPTPEMQHIDYGLSVLTAPVLQRYEDGEPFDLASLYSDLSRQGDLAGFEVTERFYEIGSFSGLKETEEFFSSSVSS